MTDLKELLKFIDFTHRFQLIKRQLLVTGEERNENDAEHSFQLALVGWYLIEQEKLKLDVNKVIQYALLHDLVEVYAGDLPFDQFFQDQIGSKEAKVKREKLAHDQIKRDFPDFASLDSVITGYEQKSDSESCFVYALDKVLPVLNIYLDQGKSWKRDQVTLSMLRIKDQQVALSEVVTQIWQKVVVLLEKEEQTLFT